MHILPNGFQRVRYYGFMGNRDRQEKLDRCRRLLGMPHRARRLAFAAQDSILPHSASYCQPPPKAR